MHARMRKVACVVYPFSHVDHEHVPTSGFGACEVQILRIQWGGIWEVNDPFWGKKVPGDGSQKSPVFPLVSNFQGWCIRQRQ